MTALATIELKSRKQMEMIDITASVREFIGRQPGGSGLAVVYAPHTTAGVTINESADPAVPGDILAALARAVPADGSYRHAEGNSPAHVMSSLVGASALLIVEGGQPLLGTWQAVYFCEFDGPRRRQVHFRFIPA